MNENRRVAQVSALVVGIIAVAGGAYGEPEIAWYSIDAGAAVSTGGTLELRGVIGQPDAGPALTGGIVELTGGFLGIFASGGTPGCNAADVAEPYGLLDLADINLFATSFLSGDLIADLNGSGLLDLSDINLFVAEFLAGCP